MIHSVRNITSPAGDRAENVKNPLNLEIITPALNPEFMNISLNYMGFCMWSIVKKNGLLIPGRPSIGVVIYKNMY